VWWRGGRTRGGVWRDEAVGGGAHLSKRGRLRDRTGERSLGGEGKRLCERACSEGRNCCMRKLAPPLTVIACSDWARNIRVTPYGGDGLVCTAVQNEDGLPPRCGSWC
jgi:hypothetical protein